MPALVLVVVFADEDGFLAGLLDGVVFCDHVGRAVNPQTVPSTDGANVVAVKLNIGASNADTGPIGCTGDGVAFCVDLRSVVGGDAGTFLGGDGVVVDLEGVLNVSSLFQGVGVNSVALYVDLRVGEGAGT